MPAGTTRQRRCGRERYFAGVSPRLFRRRPLETHRPRLGKVIPLETPVYGRQAVLAAGRNRRADQKTIGADTQHTPASISSYLKRVRKHTVWYLFCSEQISAPA